MGRKGVVGARAEQMRRDPRGRRLRGDDAGERWIGGLVAADRQRFAARDAAAARPRQPDLGARPCRIQKPADAPARMDEHIRFQPARVGVDAADRVGGAVQLVGPFGPAGGVEARPDRRLPVRAGQRKAEMDHVAVETGEIAPLKPDAQEIGRQPLDPGDPRKAEVRRQVPRRARPGPDRRGRAGGVVGQVFVHRLADRVQPVRVRGADRQHRHPAIVAQAQRPALDLGPDPAIGAGAKGQVVFLCLVAQQGVERLERNRQARLGPAGVRRIVDHAAGLAGRFRAVGRIRAMARAAAAAMPNTVS